MKNVRSGDKGSHKMYVKEGFVPYDIRQVDSKNRVTLGGKMMRAIKKRMKVDSYQVFVGESGDILLRPAVSVPSSEAWVYRNPQVVGRIRKGLEEARQGKIEPAKDLDKFLEKL